MGWIKCKSVWFGCPHFADVFEGGESLEGLQPPPISVGVNEVLEMRGQLGMADIMVSFDGGLPDRPVHPFDLPVGPSCHSSLNAFARDLISSQRSRIEIPSQDQSLAISRVSA